MGDSHRKPLSAFMAVVMRLGSSSKTRPLLLEPQVHPDFFPDLLAPQKSIWSISGRGSAPRMLRGKLIPGGLAREGQRKCLASIHHGEQPVVTIQAEGRARQEVRRAGWTPYSPFPSGSFLTSPIEREGKVTFLKHCCSQILKRELFYVWNLS